jgi:hypothetical protein
MEELCIFGVGCLAIHARNLWAVYYRSYHQCLIMIPYLQELTEIAVHSLLFYLSSGSVIH